MRKIFILAALFGVLSMGWGQPNINIIDLPSSVDIYDKYELSFRMGNYDNPYDPEVIDVYAIFKNDEGSTYRVNGFYYESYELSKTKSYETATPNRADDGWKIRFTPVKTGRWTFTIHAVDQQGAVQVDSYDGKALQFQCRSKDNAKGFIRRANAQYLKREVFANGQTRYQSFYPVGPNVAWYSSADYYVFSKPYGIYDYQRYIDSLTGNANYMRIWLTRYQYLSLYGPEHAIKENGAPAVYFNTRINQKDAAELDWIVSYASSHGITLMPCFFTFGDFRDDSEGLEKSKQYGSMPSGWRYNPYHTVLGLQQPVEFFTNAEAKRITRNLIRYIVARWGYATNIMSWELWNELDNIFKDSLLSQSESQAVIQWHKEMKALLLSADPYRHLVTTSLVRQKGLEQLFDEIYTDMDMVQHHKYQNIQKARSKDQSSATILNKSIEAREQFPDKPYFMGEYGLNSPTSGIDNFSKDPKGFDLHNFLWSSVFSGGVGPVSFWYWRYLDKQGLFKTFKPMNVFCSQLPILSETFVPSTTGIVMDGNLLFPNNLETYYLVNAAEDTLLGWAQDDAYSYQSLRRLTDRQGNNGHFDNDGVFDPSGYVYTKSKSRKPMPSLGLNSITFYVTEPAVGARYRVRWFDAETGLEMTSEATTVRVQRRWFRKRLTVEFPSSVRNLEAFRINNTYGDAVFVITKISD